MQSSEPLDPASHDASVVSQTAGVEDASPVADGVEHSLEPRWIALQRTTNWSRLLIALPVGAGLTALVASLPIISAANGRILWVLWGIWSVYRLVKAHIWPPIQYKYMSYRIDQAGIDIRDGVIWRSVTTVPRSRVQHTDVSQGPWQRRFGLASLVIHTAGRSSSTVPLEGVTREKAVLIRDFLLAQKEDDAV